MPRKHVGLQCMHGPENTFILTSPVGDLELICCPKGIHKLHLVIESDEQFDPQPHVNVHIRKQLYEDNGYTYKSALDCVDWLETYFHNSHNIATTNKPIMCHLVKWSPSKNKSQASTFTDKVWQTLAHDIPHGNTVSYGELAVKSGATPKSSRAVGQAMRTNPISIIVPCHRVILSTGHLGNYSAGQKNSVKAWLLKHEAVK